MNKSTMNWVVKMNLLSANRTFLQQAIASFYSMIFYNGIAAVFFRHFFTFQTDLFIYLGVMILSIVLTAISRQLLTNLGIKY